MKKIMVGHTAVEETMTVGELMTELGRFEWLRDLPIVVTTEGRLMGIHRESLDPGVVTAEGGNDEACLLINVD